MVAKSEAKIQNEMLTARFELQGSLLKFTQFFYKLRTGRMFDLSFPTSRESHYLTIMRELVYVFRNPSQRLLINVPPGHGKSTILQHFVAWSMSQYPDSQFIYVSYAKNLAEKHTAVIKQIMELPHYKKIFDIDISTDSSAKGNFKTTAGGSVMAFGSAGGITGQDAGLPNLDRFSGCVILDDPHKPDEVHSDTIRQGVIDNYNETIKPRPRGANVPMIFLGQRLHEDDLAAYLINGNDGYEWKKVILKAIDENNNALCPNINSLQMLRIEQDKNPYVFSAQYQQDPQPAGGGIFKSDWFYLLDEDPEMLGTFITADTAETDKEWNDATVFSFWGLYKIKNGEVETDDYGLHWIDCVELRIEPKDLRSEFMSFYGNCMRYKVKPKLAAIEKKSTGVTLVSVLKEVRGLFVREIERTRSSGSKTARFLEAQPYVSGGLISFTRDQKHVDMCIRHMSKITANNTHRFDDICDTLSDAIKLALVDKVIISAWAREDESDNIVNSLAGSFRRAQSLRMRTYGNGTR